MSVEEALTKLRESLSPKRLDDVEVDLLAAVNLISAEDIQASVNIPEFNRSAVEGYAVKANETTSASATNPVELKIIGRSEAGFQPNMLPKVQHGEAVEIYTGAPMPPGADAVVMVEYTKRVGDNVLIHRAVGSLQNVSRSGEDFAAGEVVLRKGTRIKPWHIGALASLNISKVRVQRRIRVAVVSTGSELKEVGGVLRGGEIVNSSKPMLICMLRDEGCEALDMGTVPDDATAIQDVLRLSVDKADLVITTGGTSVGEKDLTPEIVNTLGPPGVIIHGVAMRPAKPTGIGIAYGKPIFMLSGYPVAAMVGFEVFVVPTLYWMQGTPRPPRPRIVGRLTRKVATQVGSRSYLRVKVVQSPQGFTVIPLRLTGSGILSSITKANGILEVPADSEGYDEGEEVEVTLIQPIEADS